MKKMICAFFLLLALLLCACQDGAPPLPASAPQTTQVPAPSLAGVWVNAGQYADGKDFVETLTLRADGTATVHLDYQGADYATLEGLWTAADGVLAVDFTDPNTRDRTYPYTLTQTTLVLTGDGKDVEYLRQSDE